MPVSPRLVSVAAVFTAVVLFLAFFAGVFNPVIEFVFLFGLFNFVLLLLMIAVFVGVSLYAEGTWKLFGVMGLMVIAFIFLFIPNFVITFGFASLFSLGFLGFFITIIILDILSPPYPTLELVIMIPLKKYFGVPFWIGEAISLGLAVVGLLVIAAFYYPVWDIFIQNFEFSLFHVIAFVIYFVVMIFGFDRLVEHVG